jgi:hypothetical protein
MKEVQETLSEENVKSFYRRIIRKLIKDFVDEMERQRKRAIEMDTPAPTLIRNTDDFIRLYELERSLSENQSASEKTQSLNNESEVEEQMEKDEETRKLLRQLYERKQEFLKNKGKDVA